eukprot:jgi/Ulvmu1/10687/UM067_0013.1
MVKADGTQSKVHYKASESDFVVFIADTEALQKWKSDKSVPLVEVVQSFQIFTTEHGAQGIMSHASNAMLDSEFGTHKEEDVVQKILESGTLQESSASAKQGVTNVTKGGMVNH